jgi:hypothetical protein
MHEKLKKEAFLFCGLRKTNYICNSVLQCKNGKAAQKKAVNIDNKNCFMMKKFFLNKAFVALLAMTMCVTFASCGDDDDDEVVVDPSTGGGNNGGDNNGGTGTDEVTNPTAKVTYTIELDSVYYEYFNVTASYVSDGDSTVLTKEITKNQTIEVEASWKSDLGARISVKLEPKYSEIDSTLTSLVMNSVIKAEITLYDSNNKEVANGGEPREEKLKYYDDYADIVKYLTKEHTLTVWATPQNL